MTTYAHMDWDGDRLEAVVEGAAVDGIELACEHLLGLAKAVVPIEEHILEASGDTDIDPQALTGSVFFDTVYAVRQHEELTWRHDPGRQAKYLEGPMDANADVLQRLVAAPIQRRLRG